MITNDGFEEIFIVKEYSRHLMIRLKNGSLTQEPVPYPSLEKSVILWIDYDNDGWTDLYINGLSSNKNRSTKKIVEHGRIYKNQKGKFVPTNITFNPTIELVDSANAIDFNEDGKTDILLGVRTSLNRYPSYNHIYINDGENFKEEEFPFDEMGPDKLMGISMATINEYDLDSDGQKDIIISGSWYVQLSSKAYITVVYKKGYVKNKKEYYLSHFDEYNDQLPDIRGEFVIKDLDRDGDMDIFAYGRDRKFDKLIKVLENESGKFNEVCSEVFSKGGVSPLLNAYSSNIIPMDINSDGLHDFICFPGITGRPIVTLKNVSKNSRE